MSQNSGDRGPDGPQVMGIKTELSPLHLGQLGFKITALV